MTLERSCSSRSNSFHFFVLKYLFLFNFCLQLWEAEAFKAPNTYMKQNSILFPHEESISIIISTWSTCTYTARRPPKWTFCRGTHFFLNVLASRVTAISISSVYSMAYYIILALSHFVIYNLIHELVYSQGPVFLNFVKLSTV